MAAAAWLPARDRLVVVGLRLFSSCTAAWCRRRICACTPPHDLIPSACSGPDSPRAPAGTYVMAAGCAWEHARPSRCWFREAETLRFPDAAADVGQSLKDRTLYPAFLSIVPMSWSAASMACLGDIDPDSALEM